MSPRLSSILDRSIEQQLREPEPSEGNLGPVPNPRGPFQGAIQLAPGRRPVAEHYGGARQRASNVHNTHGPHWDSSAVPSECAESIHLLLDGIKSAEMQCRLEGNEVDSHPQHLRPGVNELPERGLEAVGDAGTIRVSERSREAWKDASPNLPE